MARYEVVTTPAVATYSASSILSGEYPASGAFDKGSISWVSAIRTTPDEWVSIDFKGVPHRVIEFDFKKYPYDGEMLRYDVEAMTPYGWVAIYKSPRRVKNQIPAVERVTVTTPVLASQYRFICRERWTTGGAVGVTEITLYADDSPLPPLGATSRIPPIGVIPI